MMRCASQEIRRVDVRLGSKAAASRLSCDVRFIPKTDIGDASNGSAAGHKAVTNCSTVGAKERLCPFSVSLA